MPQRRTICNREYKQASEKGKVHCHGLSVRAPSVKVLCARIAESAEMGEVGCGVEFVSVKGHTGNVRHDTLD